MSSYLLALLISLSKKIKKIHSLTSRCHFQINFMICQLEECRKTHTRIHIDQNKSENISLLNLWWYFTVKFWWIESVFANSIDIVCVRKILSYTNVNRIIRPYYVLNFAHRNNIGKSSIIENSPLFCVLKFFNKFIFNLPLSFERRNNT